MTQDQQRLADYLAHIAQAIERIAAYTRGVDEAGFMSNTLVQDAVIRNIEIIGEASRNIEQRFPVFAAAHPALPLAIAYQMRNAVAHGYFKIDFEIVWKTLERDLPPLLAQVRTLLAQLHGSGGLVDVG
jgi:uncharacterized protein with HEPN domain